MSVCYFCGECAPEGKPHRGDECRRCRRPLKVCRNCRFYDPSAAKGCREPQAEAVREKEAANFCDYFEWAAENGTAAEKKENSRSRFDSLFR